MVTPGYYETISAADPTFSVCGLEGYAAFMTVVDATAASEESNPRFGIVALAKEGCWFAASVHDTFSFLTSNPPWLTLTF